MWHMNLRLSGSASISSRSIRPVTADELKLRYATTAPSNAPERHSAMKSARLVALGTRTSECSAMEAHVAGALGGERAGGVSKQHTTH